MANSLETQLGISLHVSRLGSAATWFQIGPAGAGIVIGTGLALIAGRGASILVFGLKPWVPMTLAGAALLLAVVSLVASLVPSLRATNVNPMDSLRAE
jgi:ABC-type antimicrobial peptide transport system permease subunit